MANIAPLILHCTERATWDAAVKAGRYVAPSLAASGFIHFSAPGQVLEVANRLFRGQSGLVLLCVDPARLRNEVRYENTEGGQELFPHGYGPVNLDAVVDVVEFPCDPDGTFRMPASLARRPAGF
jgi:uncharacterized protein (DUF952 family)